MQFQVYAACKPSVMGDAMCCIPLLGLVSLLSLLIKSCPGSLEEGNLREKLQHSPSMLK